MGCSSGRMEQRFSSETRLVIHLHWDVDVHGGVSVLDWVGRECTHAALKTTGVLLRARCM